MSYDPEATTGAETPSEPRSLVGYIVKVNDETFIARLVIRDDTGPAYEAEFDKSTIPPEDADKIQDGTFIELVPEPKSEPIEQGSSPFRYRVVFKEPRPLTQAEIDEAMREVFGLDKPTES